MKNLKQLFYFLLISILAIISQNCKDDPASPENLSPKIDNIIASPNPQLTNSEVILSCVAADPDGDALAISWSSAFGVFTEGNLGAIVKWNTPNIYGEYHIIVNVSDGKTATQDTLILYVASLTFPPFPPKQINPSNDLNNTPLPVTFSWHSTLAANKYGIQISTDSSFTSLVYNKSNIQDTTELVYSLNNNTKYFWRINAGNNYGNSNWSESKNFTTITSQYQTPNLIQPTNGIGDLLGQINFIWSSNTGANKFFFQLANDQYFNDLIVSDSELVNTTYAFNLEQSYSTYFWRVRGIHSGGYSSWSEVFSFSTRLNESELLVEYLEQNGDFINTSAPALISANDLYSLISSGDQTISVIDLRSTTDYAAGHIQGAINVTSTDLLNYYQSNNLQIKSKVILVCYTGQTAGFSTTILRLGGYYNVYDLKWGMCSWSYPTRWQNAALNGQTNPITLQTTANGKNTSGSLPIISTGKTTATEILLSRLTALSTEGFNSASIDRTTLYSNLSNYYIVNYWPEADYNVGHIEGAIQYTPKNDLRFSLFLKTLPTNKTIIVYDYTGQTSAHIVAYLRALGYDAKSLLYGTNNLFYDAMPGTKWFDSECKNYPVVQ